MHFRRAAVFVLGGDAATREDDPDPACPLDRSVFPAAKQDPLRRTDALVSGVSID
jgi:hypothetical protein